MKNLILISLLQTSTFAVNYSLDGRCPPVPEVPHATPDSLSALNGSRILYTCDPGYAYGAANSSGAYNSSSCGSCDVMSQRESAAFCDGLAWTEALWPCSRKLAPRNRGSFRALFGRCYFGRLQVSRHPPDRRTAIRQLALP